MKRKVLGIVGILLMSGVSLTSYGAVEVSALHIGDAATVKPNVLLQGWSVGNQTTDPKNQSTRLRRAEMKVSGTIANAPKYVIMVDPAKLIPPPGGKSISADNMLQDIALSYTIVSGLNITAGQFKIPTTAEGLDPSGDLPLPERSLVGRTFGDKREMGLMVGYKTSLYNVASMVSSGRSLSGTGTGMFNDLDTRAELTPTKEFGFGSFVAIGKGFNYSKKGRWGVNTRYTLSSLVLRAEYAQAKDGALQGQGVTTEAGYWITDNLEPVLRYETFSPSQNFGPSGKAETLGVNYYLRDYNTKLQLAASALQNMAAVNGSPAISKGTNTQEVTFVVQASL